MDNDDAIENGNLVAIVELVIERETDLNEINEILDSVEFPEHWTNNQEYSEVDTLGEGSDLRMTFHSTDPAADIDELHTMLSNVFEEEELGSVTIID